MHGGSSTPTGTLSLQVIRRNEDALPIEVVEYPTFTTLTKARRFWLPQDGLPQWVNEWRAANMRHLYRGAWRASIARKLGIGHHVGALWLTVIRNDGEVCPLGLASLRVVTTAGGTKVIDFMRANDVATGQAFKYHGLGTGTNAENVADTTLQTELTTQYNPDNTRATGSQTNNGALVYRTVGTNTLDAGATIAEHGILSQAATGGGTLLDRSQFTGVALLSGDSLQSTYDFTFVAGS
jgi:hypothetical protein